MRLQISKKPSFTDILDNIKYIRRFFASPTSKLIVSSNQFVRHYTWLTTIVSSNQFVRHYTWLTPTVCIQTLTCSYTAFSLYIN